MAYAPFYQFYPEIAEKETRCLIVLDDPKLPVDNYGLIELYCDEPDCDCRRVFLSVFSEKTKKKLAIIANGWESRNFYANWLGDNDPEDIDELRGPV